MTEQPEQEAAPSKPWWRDRQWWAQAVTEGAIWGAFSAAFGKLLDAILGDD